MGVAVHIPKNIVQEEGSGKQKIEKADHFPIQPVRRIVQFGFLFVILWIGFEFFLWVHQLEQGRTPTLTRPPGVEGFLPISALISLRYWILTGVLNHIHPASVVLLVIILATGVFLKKGFCGWVCPFGLLSDYLAKLHIRLFDRRFKLPKLLDYPLRSLKYLLLFFFVYAVFVQMNLFDLHAFIYSPYNRVADIKMLKFFTEMSSTTFWVLMTLVGLSLLIPHFWCRYLCPYGALLGALSWISPLKIHRNPETCIDCKLCTKACPAHIQVHKENVVFSDECNACFQCVDACPVKDTLYMSVTRKRFRLKPMAYAWILVGLFVAGTLLAKLSGYWHNWIPVEEYKYHVQHLHDPEYYHNRGAVPRYDEQKLRVPPVGKPMEHPPQQ